MKAIFDTYFQYTEHTEPPLIFHRWCMLSAVGALLGRQYRLPFGDFNIYPNQYIMLIGDPGTRKSTAIKLARKVLSASGFEKFAAERTSKEKFLLDLEGVVGDEGETLTRNTVMTNLFGEDNLSEIKEVFIVADEFNEFVGSGNLEFLSLLGSLWDWDDESTPFKQRLKTSKSVSIYQPTINILSLLTNAKTPIDTPAIWKQCQSDLDRIEELQKLLSGLIQANKVQYVHRRPNSATQGYLIVRQSLNVRQVYVDFTLLKESGR